MKFKTGGIYRLTKSGRNYLEGLDAIWNHGLAHYEKKQTYNKIHVKDIPENILWLCTGREPNKEESDRESIILYCMDSDFVNKRKTHLFEVDAVFEKKGFDVFEELC